MAQKQVVQIGFKTVQIFKDQVLGIGSYGKVCKAQCDDLVCAAKLIHETLFSPLAQQQVAPQREHRLPFRRFQQESDFLSSMRHPNIILYLGMHQDGDTGLPVLLMELMDDSLTHFLETSTQPISYHIQVNICYDIALALSFLHSNKIIHRDLSSNNVLLRGNILAKVTDFGMARLGDINPRATRFTSTTCPGTDVYMPPEAVKDKPVYTEKIDCFSFGVITLQILTRLFPNPGDRMQEIQLNHPGLPPGTVWVKTPEINRRQSHIDKVDPGHPLLPVILNCLKDNERDRPSAEQLCGSTASLKTTAQYIDSRDSRDEDALEAVRFLQVCLEERLRQKQSVIAAGEQQLRQRGEEILHLNQDIQRLNRDIQQLEREKNQVIQGKEQQLGRVNSQLEESERVIADFQRRVVELEEQLRQRDQLLYRASTPNLQGASSYGTCNLPGCPRPRYSDPANGRVHEYCGRTHATQARKLGIVPSSSNNIVRRANQQEFRQVSQKFTSSWNIRKGSCPKVDFIYVVSNSALTARWTAYKQKLSDQTVEEYYHGTKLTCDLSSPPCNDKECGICGISNTGLDRRCIRMNINFQRFGHGFYLAPNSSKCHDYTQGANGYRAMLLCDVCPGRKYNLVRDDLTLRLKGPPPGYDCLFGQVGGSLNYAEIVIYNPDAMVPRYIIVYQRDGVKKIAK